MTLCGYQGTYTQNAGLFPPDICDLGDSRTETISLGRMMFTNDDTDAGDKAEGESIQLQTRGHGQ